jgi:hypothetical protein
MKQFISRIKTFFIDEKGDGIITILFSILISLILLLLAVTVVQYSMIKSSMKTAVNETLQIIKVENGADSTTKAKFEALLVKMKIDPARVTYKATPKLVQRGDPVEVSASIDYNVFALKALGVDYTVTIKVRADGLAHKYVRSGGD